MNALFRPYLPIELSSGESADPSPERALLSELLMQAARDIVRMSLGPKHPDYRHGVHALDWIESGRQENGTYFTFIQVCGYLGLNPGDVRAVIKRKVSDATFQKQVGCSLRPVDSFAWRRRVLPED